MPTQVPRAGAFYMNLKPLNLTSDQKTMIQMLLVNQLHPTAFKSVRNWVSQCFNPPSIPEMKMYAFNEILTGYGIESVDGQWQNGYWCNILFTYINMGFPEIPTIIHHREKGFIVDSIDNQIS